MQPATTNSGYLVTQEDLCDSVCVFCRRCCHKHWVACWFETSIQVEVGAKGILQPPMPMSSGYVRVHGMCRDDVCLDNDDACTRASDFSVNPEA